MKKFQSINENLFTNDSLNKKRMSAILGGSREPNETGGGTACFGGQEATYSSDYIREDGGKNYSGVKYTGC